MKKIVYILLGLILVIVIGIGVLVTLVNPNQFKPMLAEQVKQMTGRELVINGDISWRFFPSIGLSIGDTEFRNPTGFAEPNLLQFKNAELSVAVLPLLSHHLEIGEISLNGARVFIQTLKNGTSNLDGLMAKKAEKESSVEQPKQASSVAQSKPSSEKWTVSLAGVSLVNASAEIRNEQTHSVIELNKVNFSLDNFTPNAWAKAKLSLDGKLDALSFSVNGETDLNIASNYKSAELKAFDMTMSAKNQKMNIRHASVNIEHFKLGEWGNINFRIDGMVPDLAFVTKGQTELKVSPDYNLFSLQGLTLDNDFKGQMLPRPDMKVSVSADASYDVAKKLATITHLVTDTDDIKLTGKGSFLNSKIPVIRFDLASDNINLDRLLNQEQVKDEKSPATGEGQTVKSSETNTSVKVEQPTKSNTLSSKEPDLAILKQLDVAGKLTVGKLQVANAKMSDVKVDMSINKGVLNVNPFSANLYGGTVAGKVTINANPALPTYHIQNQVNAVNIQQLLKDISDKDKLAGLANINANLSGSGLSELRLRSNTSGSVSVNIDNGVVYGVNVPEMVREAKAALKGKKVDNLNQEKKTDFSALGLTLQLANGVASTNNLHIASPLLNIRGQGQTNLVNESLDFSIKTSVIKNKGQEGKEKGLTVPIDVRGTWQQPKYQLDIKALFEDNKVFENKVKKELNRGLDKLFGDKAKDENIKNMADKLLNGLFN